MASLSRGAAIGSSRCGGMRQGMKRISLRSSASQISSAERSLTREKSVESIEKAFVIEALKRNAWNVTRSAEDTGMQRANFQALMKKHNVRLRGGSEDADEAEPG